MNQRDHHIRGKVLEMVVVGCSDPAGLLLFGLNYSPLPAVPRLFVRSRYIGSLR